MPDPWHTDTCIGNWFYDVHHPCKQPEQIIEMLADIISKHGGMLLNILQRPDGTLDEEAEFILKKPANGSPSAARLCTAPVRGGCSAREIRW